MVNFWDPPLSNCACTPMVQGFILSRRLGFVVPRGSFGALWADSSPLRTKNFPWPSSWHQIQLLQAKKVGWSTWTTVLIHPAVTSKTLRLSAYPCKICPQTRSWWANVFFPVAILLSAFLYQIYHMMMILCWGYQRPFQSSKTKYSTDCLLLSNK